MTTEEHKLKRKLYMRAWHKRHPGYASQVYRKSRDKNPDGIKAFHRAYRLKNKDRIRLKNAEYKKANREKVLQWKRESYQRTKAKCLASAKAWHKANPEKTRIAGRAWSKRNKEHGAESRRIRRTRQANGGVFDCSKKIALLKLERFCQWCCCRLTPKNFTIDHIIAIARGGRHHPENLAACCQSCNSSKCDKVLADWLPTLREAA